MAMGEKRIIPWSVNGVAADGAGNIALGTGQVTGLDAALQTKADKTAVDTALQTKADKTAVETALSHKANWNGGVLSGGSILEWALRQEINTCCSCDANVTELPQSGYWMMRLYIYPGAGWRCLEAENVLTMELCRNVYNVNRWSGWARLATATPPQEYAIPLAAGFSEYLPCRYWRTQDGEVKAVIRVGFGAVSSGQVCAVLPAGYRPGMLVSVTFTAHLDNAAVVLGHADLETDGSVKLYPYQPVTTPGNAILNPFVFVAHR